MQSSTITFDRWQANDKGIHSDKQEFSSYDAAKSDVERLFKTMPDAVWFDERRFENGAVSLSIKNRQGKIIYQLKKPAPCQEQQLEKQL